MLPARPSIYQTYRCYLADVSRRVSEANMHDFKQIQPLLRLEPRGSISLNFIAITPELWPLGVFTRQLIPDSTTGRTISPKTAESQAVQDEEEDSYTMGSKIRPFRGLKNGKQDPNEFLEDIEWAYNQEYSRRSPTNGGGEAYKDRTLRILFRRNLEAKAVDWYADLDPEVKADWVITREQLLKALPLARKDTQMRERHPI